MPNELLFVSPEFPKNNMGLRRGSIIQANEDIPCLGLERGDRVPLGYDGEYVRCMGYTWSIDQIVDEIHRGFWTITEDSCNLSNEQAQREFIQFVEQRSATRVDQSS